MKSIGFYLTGFYPVFLFIFDFYDYRTVNLNTGLYRLSSCTIFYFA